jgi:hypothetical protein
VLTVALWRRNPALLGGESSRTIYDAVVRELCRPFRPGLFAWAGIMALQRVAFVLNGAFWTSPVARQVVNVAMATIFLLAQVRLDPFRSRWANFIQALLLFDLFLLALFGVPRAALESSLLLETAAVVNNPDAQLVLSVCEGFIEAILWLTLLSFLFGLLWSFVPPLIADAALALLITACPCCNRCIGFEDQDESPGLGDDHDDQYDHDDDKHSRHSTVAFSDIPAPPQQQPHDDYAQLASDDDRAPHWQPLAIQ